MSYKIQSDRLHIYSRGTAGMYVGETEPNKHNSMLLIDGKLTQKELIYSSALNKIINEIIDNSVDALNKKSKGKINITITNDTVTIKDNGDGIPIKNIKDLDGADILTPKACWGLAKAGGSFDKEDDNTNLGTYGVGSFCTNVFSNLFIGITCDGTKEYKGTWTENALHYTEEIKNKKTKGTTVQFKPDLERFDATTMDNDLLTIVKQRIINLSLTYTNIEFTFNKEVIKYKPIDIVKSYGENYNIYENEKFTIAVLENIDNNFECYTTMNGLSLVDGNHIQYILKYVVDSVTNKLPKKYLNLIKPGDIKNKIKIVFIGRQFSKIKFESQTKEVLKNNNKEISEYLGDDWKSILADISKNKELIKNITSFADIKAEHEARKELKNIVKPRAKIRIEKYLPAINTQKYLALSEGLSASASISSALGRDEIGYYPLKGKMVNCFKSNLQQIKKNQEIKEIIEILGIDFKDDTKSNYENVLIITDRDLDGYNITMLILTFFIKFMPNFIKQNRIKMLATPIIILYNKGIPIKAFFSLEEYNIYTETNSVNHKDVSYKKGLSSLSEEDYEFLFKDGKFEDYMETLTFDDNTEKVFNDWMGKDTLNRKELIIGNSFDIYEM